MFCGWVILCSMWVVLIAGSRLRAKAVEFVRVTVLCSCVSKVQMRSFLMLQVSSMNLFRCASFLKLSVMGPTGVLVKCLCRRVSYVILKL